MAMVMAVAPTVADVLEVCLGVGTDVVVSDVFCTHAQIALKVWHPLVAAALI
mgnify:CR=1 FL=1